MKIKRKSLRFQLLFWLIVPIITLLILSIGSNYWLSTQFANAAFDDGLEDLTRTLAGRIQLQNGKFLLNSSLIAQNIIEYDDVDKDYYLILGPKGEYIAGDPVLGKPPFTKSELSYRNMIINGDPVRVASIHVPYHYLKQSGVLTIQMAETFNGRDELTDQILVSTLVHQLVLILLAIASVWIGVSWGLMPLRNIRKAIIERPPNDLTPIDKQDVPEEISPLIEAFNTLMSRLGSHIEMQRRFLANAAHQLRTPLAGLQTQTELLMREDIPNRLTPAVQQIERGVDRSVRLVTQLLTLARSEPNLLEPAVLTKIDLTEIATKVTEAFVPQALAKHMDLGLSVPDSPVYVLGHDVSLYEMLSNLVDNALSYTPEGGRVTVRVTPKADAVKLVVEDNGVGIPLEERGRVFERFYRLPGNRNVGSGLGLSIVFEIVQLHHATITISNGADGNGTSIQILFPVSLSS